MNDTLLNLKIQIFKFIVNYCIVISCLHNDHKIIINENKKKKRLRCELTFEFVILIRYVVVNSKKMVIKI